MRIMDMSATPNPKEVAHAILSSKYCMRKLQNHMGLEAFFPPIILLLRGYGLVLNNLYWGEK